MHTDQDRPAPGLPALLGAIPAPGGGATRYLGYADGVYAQPIGPGGELHPITPVAPWSVWPETAEARALTAQPTQGVAA